MSIINKDRETTNPFSLLQSRIEMQQSLHSILLTSWPLAVSTAQSLKQIKSGSALPVILSTTIFIITVVKMLWTHEVQLSESTTNFDQCDDEYSCR